MKKMVWQLTLLAIGLGFQSAAVAQGGDRAANVRVALVSVQSIAPETIVPGTVVSRNDARLSAEVTGRLIEVADVGTVASKGDVIAKIEDTTISLRKDELVAEVGRARARLKYLESEERRYVKLAESNLAAATKLEETR
ncbi:MAG: hypothetical protein QNK19_18415, partial [Xanthomonadales bacterium]|nr:hypothetical protein [Xanthomonadales bacterium]